MHLFPCPCVNNFFSRQHVDTSRAIGLMLLVFLPKREKLSIVASPILLFTIEHVALCSNFTNLWRNTDASFFLASTCLREQRMDLMVLVIGKLYSSASVSLLTQVKIIYSSAMKLSFRPDKSKSCPLTTDKGSKSDPSL